jgi:hypothetical protein
VFIYKLTDLWTEDDDVLSYKYFALLAVIGAGMLLVGIHFPNRVKCQKLKIKHIVVQQYDNDYQIARITVNGKTGTVMSDSIIHIHM